MNRIDKKLAYLQANNRKMLSPYVTAGDPHPRVTVELMHALVDAGADILELGIPFSDPMAEGPVIQAAMERALSHGVSCHDVLEMVATFRKQDQDTPIVLMGYVNPIEQYGYERFAKQAKQVGVDGTILVDLPPEESDQVDSVWKAAGLYSIYLCSPTTSKERMDLINAYAKGYLYYVSLKGVTGADHTDLNDVKTQYQLRKSQTHLPLMIGFGIKTPKSAAEMAEFADGIVVGAALISRVFEGYSSHHSLSSGVALIHDMRCAMDDIPFTNGF